MNKIILLLSLVAFVSCSSSVKKKNLTLDIVQMPKEKPQPDFVSPFEIKRSSFKNVLLGKVECKGRKLIKELKQRIPIYKNRIYMSRVKKDEYVFLTNDGRIYSAQKHIFCFNSL